MDEEEILQRMREMTRELNLSIEAMMDRMYASAEMNKETSSPQEPVQPAYSAMSLRGEPDLPLRRKKAGPCLSCSRRRGAVSQD